MSFNLFEYLNDCIQANFVDEVFIYQHEKDFRPIQIVSNFITILDNYLRIQ